MGGVDKGLQAYAGRPLVEHALERLAAQSLKPEHIYINANRSEDLYRQYPYPVLSDEQPQKFSGPLAGFMAGLSVCQTPYLLLVPCDSPLFPLDLVQRLFGALRSQSAAIAVAYAPEKEASGVVVMRAQPVFCLLRTELQNSLTDFLAGGGRKIDAWTAQHAVAQVAFDLPHDNPHAFVNINTLEDLATWS
jgi:molybdenum cofactor guanylyltransferase